MLPGSAEVPWFSNDQHMLGGIRLNDCHLAFRAVASNPVVVERQAGRMRWIQVDISRVGNVDGTRADIPTPIGSDPDFAKRVHFAPRRMGNAQDNHNDQYANYG